MYDQKRSVREVKSFLWFECGQSALLERLKVGDADIFLIILPMHLMQGKELAMFTKIVSSIATPLVICCIKL